MIWENGLEGLGALFQIEVLLSESVGFISVYGPMGMFRSWLA